MSTSKEFAPLIQEIRKDLDWDLARSRAFHSRSKAIEHLDKHLIDFETHFTRNQGKMLWAPSAENAKTELQQHTRGYTTYCEKNDLLREINLNTDTNWGHGKYAPGNQPVCVVLFPDFYVSENGALVLHYQSPETEKWMANADKVIFVCGIEQVSPTMHEAENMMHLLAVEQGAKPDFPVVQITFGNKNSREKAGPAESFVLLLDNGRSELLAEIPQRQALYCIRCGACSEFSNFSDDGTRSVIEIIRNPFTKGPIHFDSNFLIPLSGRATEACPVHIDLKGLVLENRKKAVDLKQEGRSDALAWKAWKTAMLSRKWLNKGQTMKNFTLKSFFKKHWGEARDFPKIEEKSFNDWWLETRGKSEI